MTKKPKTKRGLGRPSTFTKAKGRAICKLLCEGWTLRQTCERLGFKPSTVRGWVLDIPEFSAHYARARELGYQAMADELLDVADDGRNDWMETKYGLKVDREATERSKLRVDTRKWLLSKALPKIYGDKLDVTNKHEAGDSFKQLWTVLSAQGAPT